jgi:CopG family transcriptional regulator/antitoxin EndoAI
MRSTKLISISIQPEFLDQLDQAAKEECRTRSELLREAVRRYLEERQWRKLTQYAQESARKSGIESEEDVLRMIEAHRRPSE